MGRESGQVKWFSNEKGYGFIERESGEDVFVHHSDIQGEGFKTLRQGEEVEYEVISAEKGPKARNVVREEDLATAGSVGGAGESAGVSGGGTGGPGDRASGGSAGEGAGGEVGSTGGGASSGRERDEGGPGRSLGSQLREKLGRKFFGND